MEIQTKELIFKDNEMGRTVIDYNFLGTNISRKTYVIKKECRHRLLRKPHSHKLPHTLIPIEGCHRLAYKDACNKIHIMDMVPGKTYYVPSDLPHDIEMGKGILDSFFTVESYTKNGAQIINYDEDFFKGSDHVRESAEQGAE